MTEDFDDFDVVTTPAASQLKSIEELATHAYSLMKQIEDLEQMLKRHKEEYLDLTRKLLPDAMAAAGTTSFTTTGGVKLTVKDFIQGTLPKDETKKAIALQWIENNGGKGIIKSELVAEFERGAGNLEKKNRAAEALADLGVAFVDKENIHPMTLAAFAREKLEAGEDVPVETLGLFAGRQCKIEKK